MFNNYSQKNENSTMNLMFHAIEFSAQAHREQYRKGSKIPYIFHPMSVGKILIEYGFEEDIVIAGLLHDTIEDTPVTADDLQREFNEHITHLVIGASEENKADTWDNRKKETLEKLSTANMELLALSCADKLDNIRSTKRDLKLIGDALWDRFNQPREKQQWYYTELKKLYVLKIKEFKSFPLAETFVQAVQQVFPETNS